MKIYSKKYGFQNIGLLEIIYHWFWMFFPHNHNKNCSLESIKEESHLTFECSKCGKTAKLEATILERFR